MANAPSQQDLSKMLSQVTARAWSDPAFKKRLLSDPASISKEFGMPLPPGVTLKVVEDTPTVLHFVLPPRPPQEELSDEQLGQVAGGGGYDTLSASKISSICMVATTTSTTPTSSCTSCNCW